MIPNIFYYAVPSIIILFGIRKYRASKWGKCRNKVRLDGKIAIVTGANTGLGYEIAKELCNRGAEVVFACRNVTAGLEAISKIDKQLTSKTNKHCIELDLGSIKSIHNFVNVIKSMFSKIDILVNNAGVSYPYKDRVKTLDGFEIHFGVNHLGHFLLTNSLLSLIHKSDYKRIVIMSSMLHERGKIYLDDLNLSKLEHSVTAYANSKLENYYFCKELAERNKDTDLKVYAVCPGWVYTSLFRHHFKNIFLGIVILLPVAFFFMRTTKQGSQTPIYCITESGLENGALYRNCEKFNSKHVFDEEVSRKLWEQSENMILEAEKRLNLN